MEQPKEEKPVSFSHFNIKKAPPKVRLTFFGKVRSTSTFTKWEWIYLTISLAGLAISLGLSLQRIFTLGPGSKDFTFAILLTFTTLFCCYYVVHSVLTERGDELMVFVISNVIVLIYCIMNYVLQEYSDIKLVRLIVICVLSPYLIGNGIWQSFTYCKSNSLIYYTVGAASSLQKTCKLFYLCSTLLKFDLQLQLSMVILVMGQNASEMNLEQKILLGCGSAVTILFIALGFLGLRKESHVIMTAFYVIGIVQPVFIAYKFYYAATHDYGEDKSSTYESTFACGFFAIIVWVILYFFMAYFGTYHFGKGLKQSMFNDAETNTTTSTPPPGVSGNAESIP